LLLRLDEDNIFSFLCKQTLQFTENKLFFLSKQALFIRAHINTAQNLLNIDPRGSKQGVLAALTHTEKKTFKNENLVMLNVT